MKPSNIIGFNLGALLCSAAVLAVSHSSVILSWVLLNLFCATLMAIIIRIQSKGTT